MHLVRAAFLSSLIAGGAWAAEPTSGFPKSSPFVPVGGPAAAAEAAPERIEFAGVSTIGPKTDFIFYDKTAKKSHWLAKGETKEGITVLNYDELREQVVVKLNGSEKTLSLRKASRNPGTGRAFAPQPQPTGFNVVSAPVAMEAVGVKINAAAASPVNAIPAPPAAPATPETAQQKQETEARMLVSDLLEIGMAQRKAYEEAQRKAASDPAAAQPNQTSATPPAAVNPTQPTGR